jgi:hypothetical protein
MRLCSEVYEASLGSRKISDRRFGEMRAMKDGDELFRFGAFSFNIEKLKKLIVDKPRDPVAYEIVPWAETFLALRRDNPTARPHSIFMRINYDYLDSISDARLPSRLSWWK